MSLIVAAFSLPRTGQTLFDLFKDAQPFPAETRPDADHRGSDRPHSPVAGHVEDAADADDGDVPEGGAALVEHPSQGQHVAEGKGVYVFSLSAACLY